jgi:hypothetical protein
MTESRGSNHIIFYEYCGKTFRTQEGYKEHKPCNLRKHN